jgi:hypothetical protein
LRQEELSKSMEAYHVGMRLEELGIEMEVLENTE